MIKGSLIIEICIALAIFSLTISYITISISNLILGSEQSTRMRSELYENKKLLEMKRASSTPLTPCKILYTASYLETLYVDKQYFADLGYDCHGDELGSHLTFQTLFKIASSTTSLDVLKGYVYITGSSTSTPNFFIVDTHSTPLLSSSLSTGSKLNDVDTAGSYSYIASDGPLYQFKVIDHTNSSSPYIIAQSTLPGVSGSFPHATSIFYYKSKVYVGTHRTAGNEFHVYDVSIPSLPQWLGSLELNHNVNSISVKDSYAYLGTSGNSKDIIIIDINDPKHMKIESSLSFLGNEDTLSVFLMGTILYAGRSKSTSTTVPDTITMDISDPLFPYIITQQHTGFTIKNILASGTTTLTAFSLPTKDLLDIDYENKKLFVINATGQLTIYDSY
jgi:hypothetical protein